MENSKCPPGYGQATTPLDCTAKAHASLRPAGQPPLLSIGHWLSLFQIPPVTRHMNNKDDTKTAIKEFGKNEIRVAHVSRNGPTFEEVRAKLLEENPKYYMYEYD